MTRPTVATVAALLLAITLIGCPSPQQESLVVFLVRHAEKADLGDDPELSATGHERSAALAAALRSSEIEYVHSSDYIRTRDTAAPMATDHGLEVELYDPRELPALVEKLRGTGGRHLVVGHSNTTPSMVELLGGSPGSPIDEKAEYDRLYIVTIGEDGAVSSVMMRYGSAYHPE